MKLQVSLSSWSQKIFPITSLFGFDSLTPVSCWPLENFLVDSLENVRFLNLSRAPSIWLFLRLLFFQRHTPGLSRDPKLWEENFLTSLLTLAQHQTWHCFRRWKAFISKSSSGLFSTSRSAFQLDHGRRKESLLKWLKEYIDKLKILNKYRR